MQAFGKAVRSYRSRLGLSQDSLASRAELDRSYVSQIERGIKNATLNSIWRISQTLQIPASELLKAAEEIESSGSALAMPTRQGAGKPAAATVLIVDDDEDICAMMHVILQHQGFLTRQARSGFDAFQVLASEPIEVVVSDIRMANGNGFELLGAMQKHFPSVPLIFITGYDDVSAEDVERMGARALVNKPFDMHKFISLIKSAMAPVRLAER